MMVHVGIDPGLTGALVVLCEGKVTFHDTPTVQIKVGSSLKNQMDAHACSGILRDIALADPAAEIMVTIEKVQPMPSFRGTDGGIDPAAERRSMGATSAFNFGMGFGMWQGICAALMLPYQLVHPATWKKHIMAGMDRTKDAGRLKAMQLYPQYAGELKRKKDVGRADALLLARYGTLFTTGRVAVKTTTEDTLADMLF